MYSGFGFTVVEYFLVMLVYGVFNVGHAGVAKFQGAFIEHFPKWVDGV